jgi:hypothetical protein
VSFSTVNRVLELDDVRRHPGSSATAVNALGTIARESSEHRLRFMLMVNGGQASMTLL